MRKSLTSGDIPMGLGMALTKNTEAMQYFSGLSQEEQRRIIDHTHSISSKQEMQHFVDHLTDRQG